MKRKGEGSKPPKPKKNKVDPLQQSLLSFYQPLRGNRQEVQQEVLGNDDDDDDDLDLVQQDEGANGTQEEAERTPFTTASSNRDRSPPRNRKAKRRRRKRSSCLRDEASDDDDDDDDNDDDRYDEEEHDSDREFLAPDDEVEEGEGVFGAHDLAQYVICDRATGSNDDHSSKSNLSQEVEGEASVPKETPAKSQGASYVVSDVSGFDDAPVERNNVKYKLLVLLDYSNSTEAITTALGFDARDGAPLVFLPGLSTDSDSDAAKKAISATRRWVQRNKKKTSGDVREFFLKVRQTRGETRQTQKKRAWGNYRQKKKEKDAAAKQRELDEKAEQRRRYTRSIGSCATGSRQWFDRETRHALDDRLFPLVPSSGYGEMGEPTGYAPLVPPVEEPLSEVDLRFLAAAKTTPILREANV